MSSPCHHREPWPLLAWLSAMLLLLCVALSASGEEFNLFSAPTAAEEPPASTDWNPFAPAASADPCPPDPSFNLFCVSAETAGTVEPIPHRHYAVKAYADWCAGCRDETVSAWLRRSKWPVIPINVDVDNDEQTDPGCEHYGVDAVPTFIVYRDRKEIARMTGRHPTQAFCDALKSRN